MTCFAGLWVQQQRTRIAAAIASVLLVCPSLSPASHTERATTPTAADRVRLESELSQAPAELRATVRRLIAELTEAGVPTDALIRKALEGLGKGVPPVRLGPALGGMAGNMTWLHAQLAGCKTASASGAMTDPVFVVRWLEVGNEVLLGGLPRDALANFVATLCKAKRPERVLLTLAELYFHLTGRLQASAPEAWSFAAQIVGRVADDEAAVNRIVVVLRDIRRRRGDLGQALRFAAGELERGASLHRVRSALRDRFLRP